MGLMVGGLFQGNTDQQLELTGEERAEAIKITFDDGRVKEMLRGKEYKVMGIGITSGEYVVDGKQTLKSHVAVELYIGEDNWTKITQNTVLVDLSEKKVMGVKEYRFVKPMMPEEVSEDEKEEAIKIALSNESVIAKIEGLEYEIVDVFALEKIMTEERVETDVYIHVNGTTTCYIARVDIRGGEVIGVTEAYRGDKTSSEKISEAIEMALNDSRVEEMIGEREYETSARQRLIGKRVVVDVEIRVKEPQKWYYPIAVVRVDPEEGKVMEINEK